MSFLGGLFGGSKKKEKEEPKPLFGLSADEEGQRNLTSGDYNSIMNDLSERNRSRQEAEPNYDDIVHSALNSISSGNNSSQNQNMFGNMFQTTPVDTSQDDIEGYRRPVQRPRGY